MTSPATQEPCPKCLGYGGSLPVEDGEWVSCSACSGKSQRAELLTQELETAMVKLRRLADVSGNAPLNYAEAAALLQHIAALQSEVTTAHARADDWHQRASQMLIDLTKAQRSVAALTQRVEAQQWQPIETAPKDGTEILAWRADAGVMLIRWDAPMNFLTEREAEQIGDCAEQYDWFYADFVSGDRLEGELVPTRWQPLPQPPAALSQEPRNG